MSWLQVVVLAVIQGVTEFLPISSSGHLVLPSELIGWPDQGLAFDVAVHLGSLFAVIFYLRKDIALLLHHWVAHGFSRQQTEHSHLAWMVLLATLPAILVGAMAYSVIERETRTLLVIASMTLLFAIVLGLADRFYRRRHSSGVPQNQSISWKTALFIGVAQVFALIPGTSRSGVTMAAALFAGMNRVQASRFSFLLSIPVIAVASMLYGYELCTSSLDIIWSYFFVGMLLSAITAYLCIYLFLAWIEKLSFMPFVWYRVGLALVLFWIALK